MTDEELKPLSDSELEFFRAQGGSVLVNEIDRIRAENRKLVERMRDHVMWLENRGYDHVAEELRAAIEGT